MKIVIIKGGNEERLVMYMYLSNNQKLNTINTKVYVSITLKIKYNTLLSRTLVLFR